MIIRYHKKWLFARLPALMLALVLLLPVSVFAAEPADPDAPIVLGDFANATVSNVTVSGTVGTAIPTQKVEIQLNNTLLPEIKKGDKVTKWFKNAPKGLEAALSDKEDENNDGTNIVIYLSGTPTAVKSGQMDIVIPSAVLPDGAQDLSVIGNSEAKWDIGEKPAPVDISAKVSDITVQGVVGAEMPANSFTLTLAGMTFANMDSGRDVSDWFRFLPDGLSVTVKDSVSAGSSTLNLSVFGTPLVTGEGAMQITIPAAAQQPGATDVEVAKNPNALWAISNPVVIRVLNGISIVSPPKQTSYLEGQTFETEGMQVQAVYSDGSTTAVSGYSFSPNGALTPGDNQITVTYTELDVTKTATQPITVAAKPKDAVASIGNVTVKGRVGEKLGGTDAVITLSNASFTSTLKADTSVASWFNLPKGLDAKVKADPGQGNVLTVTFSGTPEAANTDKMKVTIPGSALSTGKELTAGANDQARWSIEAAGRQLSSLSISKQPSKTAYTEGQHFSPAGMEVTATYNDGSTKKVTDFTFAPKDGLELSAKQVTIAYREGNVTVTASVAVRVNAATATMTDLVTDGTVGQPLKEVSVTVKLKDTTFQNLKAGTDVTSWFPNVPQGLKATVKSVESGAASVQITISGTPTQAKDELVQINLPAAVLAAGKDIKVAENHDSRWHIHEKGKELLAISITTLPYKLEYKGGESFDPTGMVVTAHYSDLSDETVRGYTWKPNGVLSSTNHEITVSYLSGGVTKTTTLPVTVTGLAPKTDNTVWYIIIGALGLVVLGTAATAIVLGVRYQKQKNNARNGAKPGGKTRK